MYIKQFLLQNLILVIISNFLITKYSKVTFKIETISKFIVKFSPPSINTNNKSDGEKNREYLAKESSNFNWTKKFGINTKNYIRGT
jgi:hypothetical protein